MWMNVYLQDELIREKMADAEQRAAHNQLLREMRQPGRFESALRLLCLHDPDAYAPRTSQSHPGASGTGV